MGQFAMSEAAQARKQIACPLTFFRANKLESEKRRGGCFSHATFSA